MIWRFDDDLGLPGELFVSDLIAPQNHMRECENARMPESENDKRQNCSPLLEEKGRGMRLQ